MSGPGAEPPTGPTSPGSLEGEGTNPPLAPPTPRHSPPSPGRAHAFRESQERRRQESRESLGVVAVVIIIVLGVYTLATARPYTGSSGFNLPPPGPTISVDLGTPTVGSIGCIGGGTAYAERIPWNGSSQPVTTGDVNLRVYEIWDRDYITDPHADANATSKSLCEGTPPNPIALWYVVLAAPNGTNILTYTQANDWTSLVHGSTNIWIANGSALVLVTNSPLWNTGRGFQVYGFSNGSIVFGTIPL